MNEEIIGCFAKSLAGHDKGTVYVIINTNAEYVYLSDGRIKTTNKPKKKKIKHMQLINKKDSDIESKQKKQINLTDDDIKRAIKLYIRNEIKEDDTHVKNRCN